MRSKLLLALVATTFLTNCGPAAVTGAAAAGYVAAQDRRVGTIVDDNLLLTTLAHRLTSDPQKRFKNVKVVNVYEGHAVLAGRAASYQDRLDAVRIAWNVEGITQVSNEITVASIPEKVGNFASDSTITTLVKSKLILTSGVSAANYSIETVDGVVYLMGNAGSQEELDKVLNVIKHTANVRKVENYVRLKNSYLKNK